MFTFLCPLVSQFASERGSSQQPYLLIHTREKQAVYIFNPRAGLHTSLPQEKTARPVKKRRVTSKRAWSVSAADHAGVAPHAEEETETTTAVAATAAFSQLFGGKESVEAAGLRRQVFDTAWPVLDGRIKVGFDFVVCVICWVSILPRGEGMKISDLPMSFRSPGGAIGLDGGRNGGVVLRFGCVVVVVVVVGQKIANSVLRVKNVLREANRTTLEDVSSFIRDAEGDA